MSPVDFGGLLSEAQCPSQLLDVLPQIDQVGVEHGHPLVSLESSLANRFDWMMVSRESTCFRRGLILSRFQSVFGSNRAKPCLSSRRSARKPRKDSL